MSRTKPAHSEPRDQLQYVDFRQVPALPALERERSALHNLAERPLVHIALAQINERHPLPLPCSRSVLKRNPVLARFDPQWPNLNMTVAAFDLRVYPGSCAACV
jgi:hypothetical protein